ncbi:MAG: hypothetical protein AAGJ79_14910 [Verrucomicrobiota bacterium]
MRSLLFFVGILTSASISASGENEKVPSPLRFTLMSADGTEMALTTAAENHVTVLEWARPDCPCTLDYYKKDVLPALQSEMRARSVKWFIVLPVKADATAEERKKLVSVLKDVGAKPDAFLFDVDFKMTHDLEIPVLPHVLIVDETGKAAYRGALDSECKISGGEAKETKKTAPVPSAPKDEAVRNYLHETLNSLLTGNPITERETKAKGCIIDRFKLVPVQ